MNIKIDSAINRYYVQTLAMIFFPGERFGEDELNNESAPTLYVRTTDTETGIDTYAEASFEGDFFLFGKLYIEFGINKGHFLISFFQKSVIILTHKRQNVNPKAGQRKVFFKKYERSKKKRKKLKKMHFWC